MDGVICINKIDFYVEGSELLYQKYIMMWDSHCGKMALKLNGFEKMKFEFETVRLISHQSGFRKIRKIKRD